MHAKQLTTYPLQRASQFNKAHFDTYDHIYAMDNANYKDIISLANNKEDKSKVQLILNELYPNKNMDVPDPYYDGKQGFEDVYQMLDKACDCIVEKLNKK